MRIHAVGDIMPGEGPYYLDRGIRRAIARRGPRHPFAAIRNLLANCDLAFGNLEVACSTVGETWTLRSRTFRGPDAAAEGLAYAGFGVLSVANNHYLTHGVAVAEDSQLRLRRAGVTAVGWRHEAPFPEPATWKGEVAGQRVAILALCDIPTSLPDRRLRVDFPAVDCNAVPAAIAKLRAEEYQVLISVHWGAEYIDMPSPRQIRLARAWVDAGAEAVLGHGPHVVQGWELRDGKPILYSLGNFLFDQILCEETRVGCIAELDLTAGGASIGFRFTATGRSMQVAPVGAALQRRWQEIIDSRCERLARISDIELRSMEAEYEALAKNAYWEAQQAYLRHLAFTPQMWSWRSAAAVVRDAAPRLIQLGKHRLGFGQQCVNVAAGGFVERNLQEVGDRRPQETV